MSDSDDDAKEARHISFHEEIQPTTHSRRGSASNQISNALSALVGGSEHLTPHERVVKFVKDIQPRKVKSQQKKYITEFAQWYFTRQPDLTAADISLLLYGTEDESDKHMKGLFETCGNTNLKTLNHIKQSSVLAIQLICMLLDDSINKRHAEQVWDVLAKAQLKQLQAMKLDRHILASDGNHADCFKLIWWFQQELKKYRLEDYIASADAIAAYNEWYAQTIAVKPTNGSNEPRTWAEVKLEDVEKEEMYIEGKDIALQEQQREMEQSQADEEETKDPLGLERIIVSNDRKSKFQAFRRMNIWKTTKKMKKNKSSTADGDGSEDEDDIEQKQTTRSGTHLIDTVIQKGSISTSSDDFNPYLFLTEVHHDTSIHKLELGLHTLQKAVNNRTDQMRQLVKDHFTQYVISKDTIDTIHLLLQSELQDTSQGRTARLKQLLDSINTQTSKLYEPLLQRKQESDRIRSVLDVLSRYRFLFDLPGSLKENIAKQQYDKVIRDYKKAKSVVVLNAKASTGVVDSKTDGNATSPTTENLGTHTISQRVLTEVEHIISDFRTSLFRRLDIATTPLEEQQRVIAWLVQLDCGTDPAWYYLKKQKEWICSMLDRAVDEMGDRMTSAYLRTRSSAGSGSIQGASRALSFGNDEFANVTGNMNSIDKFAGWNGERQGDPSPSSSRLVRTLCTILVRTMPDFFQLAQAIASGKFARPTNATPSWHVVSPSHDDRLPHDDRTRIKQLISEINRQFANYIRHSIITESIGKDEIVGYRTLPTHIGEQMHAAVKSYHAMKALAMPSEYLTDLKALNHEICVYYIEQLFRNTFITISQLHLSEDWILITTNEHNIQHRITSLPQQFKNAMIQAIQGVRAIPTVAMKSRWMIQLCAAPFLECVRAFIDTLHAAAFTSEKREETEQEEEEEEEGEDTIFQNQSIITTNYRDRRLLAVLSNLAYTSEIILPPLFTRFKSLLPAHTHTSMENEEDHIDSLIATLEKMIESAYIRFKIMGLSQPLAFGMFCAGVNWMDDSDLDLSHDDDEDDDETSRHHRSNSSTHMIRTPSTGLRSCILELILRLISIHHELYSILPREEDRKALLENIICDTCHALSVAIGHVMSDGISPKWALYVSCELDVLRDGLDHYMLDLTETSLDTCQSKLDTIIYSRYTSEECKRIRSHITSHVKSSMSIMMECFKPNVIHKRSVRKSVEDEEDEGEEED